MSEKEYLGDILVVEDDERSRRLVTNILLELGYAVDAVDGGEHALQALRRRNASFDAMVLDIQMPGMDGMAVAREVRRDPGLRELPIVALTALAQPGDAARILEAGCDAYLAKPVSIVDLRELVGTLVRDGRDRGDPEDGQQ